MFARQIPEVAQGECGPRLVAHRPALGQALFVKGAGRRVVSLGLDDARQIARRAVDGRPVVQLPPQVEALFEQRARLLQFSLLQRVDRERVGRGGDAAVVAQLADDRGALPVELVCGCVIAARTHQNRHAEQRPGAQRSGRSRPGERE